MELVRSPNFSEKLLFANFKFCRHFYTSLKTIRQLEGSIQSKRKLSLLIKVVETNFVPKVEDLTSSIKTFWKKTPLSSVSWVYLSTHKLPYKEKLCQGQDGASSKLNHILESFVG